MLILIRLNMSVVLGYWWHREDFFKIMMSVAVITIMLVVSEGRDITVAETILNCTPFLVRRFKGTANLSNSARKFSKTLKSPLIHVNTFVLLLEAIFVLMVDVVIVGSQ